VPDINKQATTYPIIAMQLRLDLVADAKRPIHHRTIHDRTKQWQDLRPSPVQISTQTTTRVTTDTHSFSGGMNNAIN
jgi:hypothetical protein